MYTAHAEPFRVSESPFHLSEVHIYFNDGLNSALSLISVCTVCPDLSVDKRRIIPLRQCFRKMFHIIYNNNDNNFISKDNIFGTDASLTYGPQIQRHTCVWLLLTQLKLFTVCTEHVRSPYTEHAASGLRNPTPLEGEVHFIQAQDMQMLQHVVWEWRQSVYSLARC